MDDLISRQAALDAVRSTLLAWSFMPEWRDNKIIEAVERLAPIQPTIEQERKKGKWIDGYKRQRCSICRYNGARSWNFCPNCGAEMRQKGENHESN